MKNTKLLVTVFNGGKSYTSQCRYAKIYLIIDAYAQGEEGAVDPLEIQMFYQKFIVSLKKQILSTKGGEAAFKMGVDGAFLNGCASVAESLKMLEDAIVLSGANDSGRRLFQIGVNCEAESYFNKDVKDPMKYSDESGKALIDTDAMIELYKKMMTDHPLLSYIEDAFGQFEF